MEKRINKDLVSKITIRDFRDHGYQFYPESINKYFFGLFKSIREEGFYLDMSSNNTFMRTEFLSIERIEEDEEYFETSSGRLQLRPKVSVYCNIELVLTKYFNSYDEAIKFVDGEFKGNYLITKL